MTTIRSELRRGPDNEPEIWANLGDILDWLDDLPNHTDHQVAAEVAVSIREMLFSSVATADLVQKDSQSK